MSTERGEPARRPAEPPYDPAAEVVGLCGELIRIDTTNAGDNQGPGERKAAEYVAGLLDEVGIQAQVFESLPGRTTLVARWGGRDDGRPPLLVHGHLDVVPAEAGDWSVHPFSGEVQDGYVWGRGAVDMKDFDAMVLSVVRARARAGAEPARPVTLLFTADEEAGGQHGAKWLVENHPDEIADCTEAIGEVGGFSVTIRDRRIYLVEAAEKGMSWMRLRARGTAGHGSMINPDNAVTRLAAAVARIGAQQWPVRLTPTMRTLLATVADIAGTEATPENAEALVEEFGDAARMLGAVLRNTTNPTMLRAGYKVNVVPTEAGPIDGRCRASRTSSSRHSPSWWGRGRDQNDREPPWEMPYDGSVVDADPVAAGRGPGGPGGAVPVQRGHGCEVLHALRHPRVRVHAAAAARRPGLHRAVPRRRRTGADRRPGVRGQSSRPVPRRGLAG
ncbi:MAG: M20/M25/M40 family metallo-hydrolase [Nocardioides sp.]